LREIESRREGKLTSSQGKPLRDSAPANRLEAQVREWKAREDGLGAGRAKSFERPNPGEQRIVRGVTAAGGCRILRGRKAQKPSWMRLTANLFVGLHIRKR
jgi:hypothetical protein